MAVFVSRQNGRKPRQNPRTVEEAHKRVAVLTTIGRKSNGLTDFHVGRASHPSSNRSFPIPPTTFPMVIFSASPSHHRIGSRRKPTTPVFMLITSLLALLLALPEMAQCASSHVGFPPLSPIGLAPFSLGAARRAPLLTMAEGHACLTDAAGVRCWGQSTSRAAHHPPSPRPAWPFCPFAPRRSFPCGASFCFSANR